MADAKRPVNIYNTKVKVTGWNDEVFTLPQDNDPYNACKRNYFLSTHNRLGSHPASIPISTTREMQQDILNAKKCVKHCVPLRAVYYMGSYKGSCKYIMREGMGLYPMGCFVTNYVTTNNYDYRHPNPQQDKPVQVDLSPPPPTYRRFSFCGRSSISKFLDELPNTTKCYPDHKKPPPYVNMDLYLGIDKNEIQKCL